MAGLGGVRGRGDGLTAELPVPEWEGHHPEQLTADDFEKVWSTARRQIAARAP
ncbi:hypothetical protein [Streptomyces synnematoformans]|uniref:Uncharacterized protein n=1 Tax=Streptomyces synnematoformans TaxID=415721 RepID=A0ABN2Y3Q8_9ACTN